jgi:hypothetical protein
MILRGEFDKFAFMKKEISKQQVMSGYYSDDELAEMKKRSLRQRLAWLEKASCLAKKITPPQSKLFNEKFREAGWW